MLIFQKMLPGSAIVRRGVDILMNALRVNAAGFNLEEACRRLRLSPVSRRQ